MRGRLRDDAGFVGGWEVVPFGLLIFVAGSLLLVNVWAVVDARMVVGDAAREGSRAFVHADTESQARHEARQAAFETLEGRGMDLSRVEIDPVQLEGGFARCAQVVVRVRSRVPAFALPFIGGFGHGFTVEGSQREIIDPFRSGVPGPVACDG